MANTPAGKCDIKLRMRNDSIRTLRSLAEQSGYATHNLLAVELLEGCLQYLTNPDQMRMPDVLLKLRQKLSLSQLEEVVSRSKKEPDVRDTLERLVGEIVERKLAAGAKKAR